MVTLFPYCEVVEEVHKLFSKEFPPEVFFEISDLIRALGERAYDSLSPVVLNFLKQQYLGRNENAEAFVDKSRFGRILLIDSMLSIGHPTKDFEAYLELELESRFDLVRLRAAKVCLNYRCHFEKAVSVLHEIADPKNESSEFSAARVALYEFGNTNCLLSDFISDIRAGRDWSTLDKQALVRVVEWEGADYLSNGDFRYLLFNQDIPGSYEKKPLYKILLLKRNFETPKAKVKIILEMHRRGYPANVLFSVLKADEVSLLEALDLNNRGDFLKSVFQSVSQKVEVQIEKDDVDRMSFHDFRLVFMSTEAAELEALFKLRDPALDLEIDKVMLIFDRLQDRSLEYEFADGSLNQVCDALATQVHQLGPSIVVNLVAELEEGPKVEDGLCWYYPFIFKCLSLFEPEDIREYYSDIAYFFSLEDDGRNFAGHVSSLFQENGIEAARVTLKSLASPRSENERKYALRALSGILENDA